MLGFDSKYLPVHPTDKFSRFTVKNCKKSAITHSMGKPILLNFVNLSITSCPRLYTAKTPLTFLEEFFVRTVIKTCDSY